MIIKEITGFCLESNKPCTVRAAYQEILFAGGSSGLKYMDAIDIENQQTCFKSTSRLYNCEFSNGCEIDKKARSFQK